jgi:hypothetical protein
MAPGRFFNWFVLRRFAQTLMCMVLRPNDVGLYLAMQRLCGDLNLRNTSPNNTAMLCCAALTARRVGLVIV